MCSQTSYIVAGLPHSSDIAIFVFADDPKLLSPSATHKDPGTILLKIKKVIIVEDDVKVQPASHLDHPALIDEKTKKAGSHVTQYVG